MMARLISVTALTLALLVALADAGSLADAVLGSASRQLAGNYDLLNSVLSGLELVVDTSSVGSIIEETRVSFFDVKVTFTLAEEATCVGLGVNNVALTSGFEADETVNGTVFERFDVTILAEDVIFRCDIGVSTQTDFFLDFEAEEGVIVAISEPSSKSFVKLQQMLLSEDYSKGPPTLAFDVPGRDCNSEVAAVSDIRFEAGGDGVLSTVAGIDITGLILDEFNGDKKASATEPISNALCDVLVNLTASINDLAVSDPLGSLLGNFDLSVNDTFAEDALRTELGQTPPADVDLIVLRDNALLNLLLPVEDGSLLLNTSSPLISGLLDFAGVSFEAGVSPVYALVDLFLGTDIAATDGSFTGLDLLELAQNFTGEGTNLTELLSFDFSLPGVGNVSIAVDALLLASTPTAGASDTLKFALLGDQTVALPPIDLGDLTFDVGVSIDLQLSAVLLDQVFAYDVTESLTLSLGWEGFLARIATLIAIDVNELQALEIGPLFSFLFDCAISVFWRTPLITAAAFDANAVDLRLTDVDDALLSLVADLANALVPLLQIESVIPSVVSLAIENLVVETQLLEPSLCPVTELDNVTSLPYDFSEGIFAFISDTFSEELVTSVLEGLDGDGAVLDLIGSPLEIFAFDISAGAGAAAETLGLALTSLAVEGLLPPDLERLTLLETTESSPYYPQGLLSELALGSPSNPLVVSIGIEVSRVLASSGRRLADDVNALTLVLSVDSIALLLDIFASLSQFDVKSTRLNEVAALSCWTAKLDPYGGVKTLDLLLANTSLALACEACDNVFLQSFTERLQDPVELGKVLRVIEDLVDVISSVVEDSFGEESFFETVAAAERTCAGLSNNNGDDDDEKREELDVADITMTLGLIAGFFASVSAAGAAACCCSIARRPDRPSPAQTKVDGDSDGYAQELHDRSQTTALWRNPAVPRLVRWLVPLFLANNLAFFVYGHIDIIIEVDVLANLLGSPVVFTDFAGLSVLSTVSQLWQGEAYLLAVLIAGFSVIWPYVKLVGMVACWFMPPAGKLTFKRRGKLAKLLDQLGKWSLVELFFVSFVLVVLQVEVQAPDEGSLSFLAGAFDVELVIKPQLSLYMFTVALMLSLALSNVIVTTHERIEHAAFLKARESLGRSVADKARLSLANYRFEKKTTTGTPYHLALSRRGAAVLALFTIIAIALSLYSASLPVLTIFFNGIARLLLDSAGLSTDTTYSLITYIVASFDTTDPGFLFFSATLVLTTLVVPLAQLCLLVVIVLRPFTLPQAINFQDANQVLRSWSALEVFVLSIVVVVLELKAITGFIVEEVCAPLRPALEALQSLDSVGITNADLDASCFGLSASVEGGAFAFLGALVVTYAAQILVGKWLQAFIDDRKSSGPTIEDDQNIFLDTNKLDVDVGGEGNVPRATSFFAKLGLVTVSSSHASSGSPRFATIATPKRYSPNPALHATIVPSASSINPMAESPHDDNDAAV